MGFYLGYEVCLVAFVQCFISQGWGGGWGRGVEEGKSEPANVPCAMFIFISFHLFHHTCYKTKCAVPEDIHTPLPQEIPV